MALYNELKASVDDLINTNGIQAITGAIDNYVRNYLIDEVGASQVYVNPAITDNPGTPQNPRAYIALPGTYTNFGGLAVTAPLGVLKWNGTAWSVTQIAIPSPYNYFRAVTTQARSAGSIYTTVNIAQSNGGWTALAGEFVQLINRRTGKFDFVQLAANVIPADTSITFVSRTLSQSFDVGSIVEIFSQTNMRWHAHIPVTSGGFSFFNVPTEWRMPNVNCITPITYLKNLEVLLNSGFRLRWEAGTGEPTYEYQFRIDSTDRTKFYVKSELEAGSIVDVKYWQPSVLEEYIPS